jgi:hypothetical protein
MYYPGTDLEVLRKTMKPQLGLTLSQPRLLERYHYTILLRERRSWLVSGSVVEDCCKAPSRYSSGKNEEGKGKPELSLFLSTTPYRRMGQWRYSLILDLGSPTVGTEPRVPLHRSWASLWAGLGVMAKRGCPTPTKYRAPFIEHVASHFTELSGLWDWGKLWKTCLRIGDHNATIRSG